VACRLHPVLGELISGGVSKEITAGQAAQVLETITSAGAVEAARWELAAELTEDLPGREGRQYITATRRGGRWWITANTTAWPRRGTPPGE
jgi:hypothetical protein